MVFMLTHKIHSIAKVVWPVDKLYDYVLCVYRKRGNFHGIHSIWIFTVILSRYKARTNICLYLEQRFIGKTF